MITIETFSDVFDCDLKTVGTCESWLVSISHLSTSPELYYTEIYMNAGVGTRSDQVHKYTYYNRRN